MNAIMPKDIQGAFLRLSHLKLLETACAWRDSCVEAIVVIEAIG